MSTPRYYRAAPKTIDCLACSHTSKSYAEMDAHISKEHPKYAEDFTRKILRK